MMREIPTIDDYKQYKAELFGKTSDEKKRFEEVYKEYLDSDWKFTNGVGPKDKFLKAKQRIEHFEPSYIEYIYVKRFIQKVGRLLYELNKKNQKYYNIYEFYDFKEFLLQEETTNKLFDLWKGFIPEKINSILTSTNLDAIKHKNLHKKSSQKKFINILGIIAIIFAFIGIVMLILKFIGII